MAYMANHVNFRLTLREFKRSLIICFGVIFLGSLCLYYQSHRVLSVLSITYQYEDRLLDITKDLKRILLWTKFFDSNHEANFLEGQDVLVRYCKKPCVISRRRSQPLLYDALIFHTRNYHNPPSYRTPNQVYIAFTMESPSHQGSSYVHGNFYNWSASTLSTSTIPVRYHRTERLPSSLGIDKLPQLTTNATRGSSSASVLWVVSNTSPLSKRGLYVEQLQSHMKVDIYGRYDQRCPEGNCYQELAKRGQYKFYLAFENSVCRDYISEKVFQALSVGFLPIVLGGLGPEDYSRPGVLPPNSYLDVRNFSSPKHLSDYLKRLDEDDGLYLSYHKWRSEYRITNGNDWLCNICDLLYDENYTTPQTLNWDEFYDPKNLCDNELVEKVLLK